MIINSKKELTPVVYGDIPVKILHFNFDKNIEVFKAHWHERIELHLVKRGSLILNCNGLETVVKQNEVSVISPTFTHRGISGDDGVEYYVIMFDIKDLYNNSLSYSHYIKRILNGDIHFKSKTDAKKILNITEEIVKMNTNQNEHHTLEIVGSLYRLLGLLCNYCIDKNTLLQPKIENFDEVIDYINLNFNKKISVDTISRHFNYEKSYFCRKFKSVTGMNATKYIRVLRLENARHLLKNTNKSIIEIAFSCGFSDSAYFINCFKNMYNITPLVYRKQKTI